MGRVPMLCVRCAVGCGMENSEAGRELPKGQCAMSGDREWRTEAGREPPKGQCARVSVEIGNGESRLEGNRPSKVICLNELGTHREIVHLLGQRECRLCMRNRPIDKARQARRRQGSHSTGSDPIKLNGLPS